MSISQAMRCFAAIDPTVWESEALKLTRIRLFVLSTETNPVVGSRCKKLKIQLLRGSRDKRTIIKELASEKNFNLSRTLFVGNDLNDFSVMQACGYSAADSHPQIVKISRFLLKTNGSRGIVREISEEIPGIEILDTLHPKT